MRATEETQTSTRVLLARPRSHTWISCTSIEDAIKTIKDSPLVVESKIVHNDDVVYHSERNGSIESWQTEYERQRRVQSTEDNPRDCPNDNKACWPDDLCMDCRLDLADNETIDK